MNDDFLHLYSPSASRRLDTNVAIVSAGQVVRAGTIAELIRREQRRLEDVFIDAVGAQAAGPGSLDWLGARA